MLLEPTEHYQVMYFPIYLFKLLLIVSLLSQKFSHSFRIQLVFFRESKLHVMCLTSN